LKIIRSTFLKIPVFAKLRRDESAPVPEKKRWWTGKNPCKSVEQAENPEEQPKMVTGKKPNGKFH
jgi:hypothetical protein